MTDKLSIQWRWRGDKKYTKGIVQQEQALVIKIDDDWYLKENLDVKGYVYKVEP